MEHSEEHKKKISDSLMGHRVSLEVRAKISKGHAGKTLSSEHKRKLSENHKGFSGQTHSLEARYKMSEAKLALYSETAGPWKDTKPELEFETRLQDAGLKYEKQMRVGNMVVDFYLPQQNLVIEVDGCWWHGCECKPKSMWVDKFEARQQKLGDLGYDSIRIWEHELTDRFN